MYSFIIEKKQELLKGKKIITLAKELEISRSYINNILNGKRNCSKVLAIALIQKCNENNIDLFFKKNNKKVFKK